MTTPRVNGEAAADHGTTQSAGRSVSNPGEVERAKRSVSKSGEAGRSWSLVLLIAYLLIRGSLGAVINAPGLARMNGATSSTFRPSLGGAHPKLARAGRMEDWPT